MFDLFVLMKEILRDWIIGSADDSAGRSSRKCGRSIGSRLELVFNAETPSPDPTSPM